MHTLRRISLLLALPCCVQAQGTPADSPARIVPATQPAGALATGEQAHHPAPVRLVKPRSSGYSGYWLVGCSLAGLAVGALGYGLIVRRLKGRTANEGADVGTQGAAADHAGYFSELMLKQEQLTDELNGLRQTNQQLSSEKESLEKQLKAMQDAPSAGADGAAETIFYMPQPNKNGRFQEASRRPDAANALYAFHVAHDNQQVASFEFVARDAYLSAAIGNEPTWISVACDRTNQPSATTTRVKTESPGSAILNNGEWEITRKARITYL